MKPKHIQDDPVANKLWNHYRAQIIKDTPAKWKPKYEGEFGFFVDALTGWIDAAQRLVAARAKAKSAGNDLGDMLLSRKSTLYRNPLVDLKCQYAAAAHKYGSMFGLNPFADAALRAVPNGTPLFPDDPMGDDAPGGMQP